jgi:hypothetical protein
MPGIAISNNDVAFLAWTSSERRGAFAAGASYRGKTMKALKVPKNPIRLSKATPKPAKARK